jgi:hypothetical protein
MKIPWTTYFIDHAEKDVKSNRSNSRSQHIFREGDYLRTSEKMSEQ